MPLERLTLERRQALLLPSSPSIGQSFCLPELLLALPGGNMCEGGKGGVGRGPGMRPGRGGSAWLLPLCISRPQPHLVRAGEAIASLTSHRDIRSVTPS